MTWRSGAVILLLCLCALAPSKAPADDGDSKAITFLVSKDDCGAGTAARADELDAELTSDPQNEQGGADFRCAKMVLGNRCNCEPRDCSQEGVDQDVFLLAIPPPTDYARCEPTRITIEGCSIKSPEGPTFTIEFHHKRRTEFCALRNRRATRIHPETDRKAIVDAAKPIGPLDRIGQR